MTSAWVFFLLPKNHIDNFSITCKILKKGEFTHFSYWLSIEYLCCLPLNINDILLVSARARGNLKDI